MPTRAQLEELARAAALEFGIPPDGFVAQVGVESAWNPNAVNPESGAMGLAQVLPPAISDSGVPGDPFDPQTNLRQGASYMRWCRRWLRRNGVPYSWPYVLAAYNAGIGHVRNAVRDGGADWLAYMPRDETRDYVARIAPHYPRGTPSPGPLLIAGGLLALAWVAWT
jgi:soluble lytic murein transglycosylase-like protein